jgi:hypothetical protein
MSNVVKFPYDASRRVHSQKPRRSKNGTPEEGAAKAATQKPAASVTALSDRADKPCEQPDDTFPGFLDSFRNYFMDAFARGMTVDEIFDHMEDTHRRTEEAKRRYLARRDKLEISHSPVNLPVSDLGQSVLNLATEDNLS